MIWLALILIIALSNWTTHWAPYLTGLVALTLFLIYCRRHGAFTHEPETTP